MADLSYNTFDVQFEHTTIDSDTPRINRRTVTIYGESEFQALAKIKLMEPAFRDITILEMNKR